MGLNDFHESSDCFEYGTEASFVVYERDLLLWGVGWGGTAGLGS